MAYTQLNPTGTPGKRYSFSAKTAAPIGEKGIGEFTALSVLGVPGIIHSFTAKTAAVVGVKGVGEFTALSVIALPGPIHAFLAKAEAVPEVEVLPIPLVGGGKRRELLRLKRDDNELLEIISALLTKGILN